MDQDRQEDALTCSDHCRVKRQAPCSVYGPVALSFVWLGVAGGLDKAEAIAGALRGGYLDVLVTDEDVAELLLDGP